VLDDPDMRIEIAEWESAAALGRATTPRCFRETDGRVRPAEFHFIVVTQLVVRYGDGTVAGALR
jgi:hypothetical protein